MYTKTMRLDTCQEQKDSFVLYKRQSVEIGLFQVSFDWMAAGP